MPHSLIAVSGFLLGLAASGAPSGGNSPYQLANTLHVGDVGGWDYLTVDSDRNLLYIPRSTHTMVLNADTGAVVADISGQRRNHGVALVPSAGRGFISDGEDTSVTILDLRSNKVLGKVKAREDADGIIYDQASNRVLVVCGDAGVLVPINPEIDPKNGSADPAIELGGKPEFFATDGTGKVYVNLENKDEVAVVNIKAGKVMAYWPTAPGGAPVGMAIDSGHHRLFIGCRKPQKLLVMDCDNGKVLADLPIGRGVDAVNFDDGYAIASCGDGTLTVVGESAPGQFKIVQTLATPPGARTEGLNPKTHVLYLPTSEMEPSTGQGRPHPKPGTFMVVEVTRSS